MLSSKSLRITIHPVIATIFLLSTILVMGACSDDPATGIDDDLDPPPIPGAEDMPEMDASYFEENGQQQSLQEFDDELIAYNTARDFVMIQQGVTSMQQVWLGLLEQAEGNAEFEDGVWFWSYSSELQQPEGVPVDDSFVDGTLTGEEFEARNEVEWDMEISFDAPDEDESFSYSFLSGVLSDDYSQGHWTMYALDEDGETIPALELEYNEDLEDGAFLHYTLHESEEVSQDLTEIIYEENGPEHSLRNIVTEGGETEENVVTWNTETGTGSIDMPGVMSCEWGEDRRITECDEAPDLPDFAQDVTDRIERIEQSGAGSVLPTE